MTLNRMDMSIVRISLQAITTLVSLLVVIFSPVLSAEQYDPIPHSTVAMADGAGIIKATLSCPTSRYAHAVLGDDIEAGCLALQVEDGDVLVHQLPDNQVFEDLVPHIADFDGNGINDVAVVRSDNAYGAALALYTISENNEVEELGSTPPIGRANRWLAPVGVADFNGDDQLDIAYVQTPHIGGILKIWTFIDGTLEQIAQMRGFSNHSIRSTRVSTSKIADHNNDGIMDIALPDQRRQKTVWVTLSPKVSPELHVIDELAYDEAYFE